jgi:hypothetical protein
LTLPGQEFMKKWEKYMSRINSGQYLEQHALDPRNSDSVQTRIQLDTDSRTYNEYLKELIKMTNMIRSENGLDALV